MKIEKTPSGYLLKIIALVSMIIDHIATVIIFPISESTGNQALEILVLVMNSIGRLAAPIYLFLLAEGYRHARSKWKYLLRLGIFAIISEIPYDLAFSGAVFDWNHQSIFFSLFLGLLGIIVCDKMLTVLKCKMSAMRDKSIKLTDKLFAVISCLAVIGVFATVGYILRVDGEWAAVMAAILGWMIYEATNNGLLAFVVVLIPLSVFNPLYIIAFLFCTVMFFYRGRKGNGGHGYIWYVAYPLHLAVLALIAVLI